MSLIAAIRGHFPHRDAGLGHRPAAGAVTVAAAFVTLLLLSGCSRTHYRQRADQEVYPLLGCAANQVGAQMRDYGLRPNATSRFYDPYCPDLPPMPPDDPRSHTKMVCVDGKRGFPGWPAYGRTPHVENPVWQAYLPRNERGEVAVDTVAAYQLALLHSREYQQELEDLYLSALNVTLERFRFDLQFFGGNSTFFEANGELRGPSLLRSDTDFQVRKLTATGGELVAGLANSIVWQFSGPERFSTSSVLDFSIVQPLLRTGGRAVVLESLTQSERDLLANIRQFERYRRGFYLQVAVGRAPGPGPSVGGLGLGSFDAGGFGGVGGVMGLVELQQRIRNQEANVAALRNSVELLQIAFENNQLDNRFQVDLARQSLYSAETSLLALRNNYQDRLDSFKLLLGLPPGLDLSVADTVLDRFSLIDPDLTATEEELSDVLNRLRTPADFAEGVALSDLLPRLEAVRQEAAAQLAEVEADLQALEKALPSRRKGLVELTVRPEIRQGAIEPDVIDPDELLRRAADVAEDYVVVKAAYQAAVEALGELTAVAVDEESSAGVRPPAADPLRRRILDMATDLADIHAQLSLIQARARLDTLALVPVDLDPAEALEIARSHRQDWQNARAALVDSWRQIEVVADRLESDLDIVFDGEMRTVDNNPVKFSPRNGQLRLGLEFDAPLNRLAERNDYRAVLINYQRAKRSFYAYEDEVSLALRENLRAMRLNQLTFEVQRSALQIAVAQVDLARSELARPSQPDEQRRLSATAARDLVGALSDLLRSQNELMGIWVEYEARRMSLDLDLGTMRLDMCGVWVDPGEITSSQKAGTDTVAPNEGEPEVIPAPLPEPPLPPEPVVPPDVTL